MIFNRRLQLLYLFSFFKIANLSITTAAEKHTFVQCPLRWIPGGLGELPVNSVLCSEGIGEYISRVYFENSWHVARLLPSKGRAFAVHTNGSVLHFFTYQVLSTPPYCQLHWDADSYDYGVTLGNYYIARGVADGQSICGEVDPSTDSTLLLPIDETASVRVHRFEVLSSVFPLLNIMVEQVTFDLSGIAGRNTTLILGQEDVKIHNLGNPIQANPSFNRSAEHQRIVNERYALEETLRWKGLQTATFNFPVWFSAPNVAFTKNVDEDIPKLLFRSTRAISYKSQFSFNPPAGLMPNFHLEVCTVGNLLDGVPIPFTAIVEYTGKGLRYPQINVMLQDLGRINNGPVDEYTAEGRISGTFSGWFVTHISSYVGNIRSPSLCCAFQTPPVCN